MSNHDGDVMTTTRKYPVSIGFTYELLQKIDDKVESSGLKSRSQLVEKILRENLDDECIQCQKMEKLSVNNMLSLPVDLGLPMPKIDDYIAERLEVRSREKIVLDIINHDSKLENILERVEHLGVPREIGIMVIDRLCRSGLIFQHPKNQFYTT